MCKSGGVGWGGVTRFVMISAGSLKTYPEDEVEEKKQELHALHSSFHCALNSDSEKGQDNYKLHFQCGS